MIIDSAFKAATLLVTVLSLPRAILGLEKARRAKLKDDYSRASVLVSVIRDNPHPYLIECGYRSLMGDVGLTSPEIVRLMSLPRPSLAFRQYQKARCFLKQVKGSPSRFQFCDQYRSKKSRLRAKVKFGSLYLFFAYLAFTPLFFFRQMSPLIRTADSGAKVGFVILMLAFGCMAKYAIDRYVGLITAERFLLTYKHKAI